MSAQNPLALYRRITIKIGSALLVEKSGKLRAQWLAELAEDIATLKAEGREIVIVSSGAIALGRGLLGLSALALTLEQSQAAASAASNAAYTTIGLRMVTRLATSTAARTLSSTPANTAALTAHVVPNSSANCTTFFVSSSRNAVPRNRNARTRSANPASTPTTDRTSNIIVSHGDSLTPLMKMSEVEET